MSAPGAYAKGVPIIRKFPFAFDTPGLLTGHTVYTPRVGDVLLDAWIEIDTAWDGTTPLADIGSFVSGHHIGWFGYAGGAVDATKEDDTHNWFEPPLLAGGNSAHPASLLSLSVIAGNAAGLATIVRALPGKFVTADPLKVVVSQDGTVTGADPGSTMGSAVLYLVTATPL